MAVSKVISPTIVQKITPTLVTDSPNYEITLANGVYNFHVVRCGKIVQVDAIFKPYANGTPAINFPGEKIASGLPKSAQAVTAAFPRSFNTSANFVSMAVNMVENSGDLYLRYGSGGLNYTVHFTYITSE